MYEAKISFNAGTDREFSNAGFFSTLESAVKYIKSISNDRCRAWINNCEVRIINGVVCDADGERIVAKGKWLRIGEMIAKEAI